MFVNVIFSVEIAVEATPVTRPSCRGGTQHARKGTLEHMIALIYCQGFKIFLGTPPWLGVSQFNAMFNLRMTRASKFVFRCMSECIRFKFDKLLK